MKKIVAAIISVTIILLANSCYYDKASLLYGGTDPTCADTTGTVSYAQKVVPLFSQYCYSCHTGSFPSGNILMGTYASDKNIALNGKLFGCVNHASGFQPMPQGMPKMTVCQIAIIRKWIDTGILNN